MIVKKKMKVCIEYEVFLSEKNPPNIADIKELTEHLLNSEYSFIEGSVIVKVLNFKCIGWQESE